MPSQNKLIVSHAPYWHNGSRVTDRSRQVLLAAAPAALFGINQFGVPALGVMALAVASAVLWEYAFTRVARRPPSVGDGTAAVIGLLFGMLLPAATAWWVVITGTFIAIVVGRQIYGGIGANPFNPVAVAVGILLLSWPRQMDFDMALVAFPFDFPALYPLSGATFGLGLILGGIYLMLRRVIRWEISVSFLAGVAVAAFLFNLVNPSKYATASFHLLTGYTLIGAFFLATEDSSSPVNFIPMVIYGLAGGTITVLIRNIGAFPDGVVYAILVINLIQPLLDKIRPKALGKVA